MSISSRSKASERRRRRRRVVFTGFRVAAVYETNPGGRRMWLGVPAGCVRTIRCAAVQEKKKGEHTHTHTAAPDGENIVLKDGVFIWRANAWQLSPRITQEGEK